MVRRHRSAPAQPRNLRKIVCLADCPRRIENNGSPAARRSRRKISYRPGCRSRILNNASAYYWSCDSDFIYHLAWLATTVAQKLRRTARDMHNSLIHRQMRLALPAPLCCCGRRSCAGVKLPSQDSRLKGSKRTLLGRNSNKPFRTVVI